MLPRAALPAQNLVSWAAQILWHAPRLPDAAHIRQPQPAALAVEWQAVQLLSAGCSWGDPGSLLVLSFACFQHLGCPGRNILQAPRYSDTETSGVPDPLFPE